MIRDKLDIRVIDLALSIDACYDFVLDKKCGGIVLFVGTVRNHNKGKDVQYLDFESYAEMAEKEMAHIANTAIKTFHVEKISMHHRTGKVELLEKAVIIAVSSVHRKEAFEACEFCIDRLKESVPIWKKEVLMDGSYWVNAHP